MTIRVHKLRTTYFIGLSFFVRKRDKRIFKFEIFASAYQTFLWYPAQCTGASRIPLTGLANRGLAPSELFIQVNLSHNIASGGMSVSPVALSGIR